MLSCPINLYSFENQVSKTMELISEHPLQLFCLGENIKTNQIEKIGIKTDVGWFP